MKKAYAVILHYGDKNITSRCIKSIIDTKNKFEEIVVVDNHSSCHPERSEGSRCPSRFFGLWSQNDKWSKKLKIIKNERNLGYAGGMNIGIKYALSKKADYILLLNNDIVFEKEILSKLTKLLEEEKDVGIAAPAIKFIKNGKTVYDLGGTVNRLFGRTNHIEIDSSSKLNRFWTSPSLPRFSGSRDQNDVNQADYVSGCSMLVKKEVFEETGLLDEDYFLYYEDVDFCLKARKKGFKTCVLPTVSIFHNLSESIGKNSSSAIYNQTRSALIFSKKNIGIKSFFNFSFILIQSFLFLFKEPGSGKHAFIALFDFYKSNFFLHILIFTFFAFLSYHKVLGFAFWKDDWSGLYQKNYLNSFFVHPAGVLEWFLLSKIFGLNAFLWQLWGILLRIFSAIALALMIQKLSKSKLAGFLAGLFISSTYAGLDTVGWASAHVSSIAIILTCLSIYFWLSYYQSLRNKYIVLYYCFLVLALLADPIRVIPVVILVEFLKRLLFGSVKESNFAKILKNIFYFFSILVLIASFLYLSKLNYSSLVIFEKLVSNPSLLLKKLYLVGNFWGSLGNLILGWVINIPEDASTGIYNKLYARIAFSSVPFIFVLFTLFIKNKSRKYVIVLFFILWIIILYIPNWIAEPRLTMGGTHRFLNFSAVGFVALVAYIISLSKRKYLIVLLASFFLIMNIKTSNRILAREEVYRSKRTVEHIWKEIDRDTPVNTKDTIFIYRGEEPIRGNILYLSGSIPLGIIRNIKSAYDLPIVTDELDLIINLLCSNNVVRYQPGKMVYQKNRIPISNIFAWEVKNDGSIRNVSKMERERIRKFAEEKCKVLEN